MIRSHLAVAATAALSAIDLAELLADTARLGQMRGWVLVQLP